MNGEIYRLNIRFDLTDESQRSIAERLQALDRKQYGSINKFIIAAIGKALDSNDSSTLTAEEVRSIIREELQDVAFVSAQPSQTQTVQPTLTEEEQGQTNGASSMIWRCLDDAKWSDFGIRTGNTHNLRHHFDATQDIPPRDKKVVFGIGLRRDTLK